MTQQGFLAIWCEMDADDLVDYRNWLTQEHIADRIYSPGFLGVRLFASVENECSHFILYATESPDVMQAPPYLQILNTPSPWTQRLMVKFGPFDRAAGVRVVKIGRGFGSHVLVSRICSGDSRVDPVQARDALRAFIRLPETVGVRLLETDRGTTGIQSAEKKMRSGREGAFDYLLVVEALCEAGAAAARESLAGILQAAIPGLQSHDSLICKTIYGEAPYEGETP